MTDQKSDSVEADEAGKAQPGSSARQDTPSQDNACDCCADIRAAEAIHGDGPVVATGGVAKAGRPHEIALPGGATLRHEARTTGAPGWLLYDLNGKPVCAMRLTDVEIIEATITAAQAAPVRGAQVAKSDYVLMPRALTAENGAKSLMMGEFKESIRVVCHECKGSGDDPEFEGVSTEHGSACPECNGEGTIEQPVTVEWDTIKRIYALAVEKLGAPATAPAAQAVQGDAIAKSQRIMSLIDDYMEKKLSGNQAASHARTAIRIALMAEFESAAAAVAADRKLEQLEAEGDAMHACIKRIRSLTPKHAEFRGQIVSASRVVHYNDVLDAVDALKEKLAEIRATHQPGARAGATA